MSPARAASVAAVLAAAAIGALPLLLALSDAVREPGPAWAALADGLLWRRLGSTLGIAAWVLGTIVPLGFLLAWLFTRTTLPLRRALLLLSPFPLFLPPLVHVLSWFSLTGLSGRPAIVVVYIVSFLPFVILSAARALEQIGRDHHETMRLLGGRRLVFLDELRQGLPGALVGAALALTFLLSDFTVADFLTSVGPKTTVYADTLYAHHLGLRGAAAAAAAVPGLAIALGALLLALRARRRLGSAVGSRFRPAPPVELGRAGPPLAAAAGAIVFAGAVLPFLALAHQAGSFATIARQFEIAGDRIVFTILAGTLAATGMILLALPLGGLSARLSRPWRLDALVFLPLAIPPLLYGIGLVRLLNRPELTVLYLGIGSVLFAMIGRYLAFAYLPLGGAVERLDPALVDAARLAGAGPLSRAWHVILPHLRSPAAAAWCVSFCFTLRELDTLVMLRAGQRSLTFHLYSNVVFSRREDVAAIALILAAITVTPLLLYLGFARRGPRFV